MTHVTAQPQTLAAAAAQVAGIGSAINEASAAAAGRTTGVLAAAADEVSEATAQLFNAYAQEYQAVFKQAAAFHDEFVQGLSSAVSAYTQAEAVNAAAAIDVTLAMGGSGLPVPPRSYVDAVVSKYITPHYPGFTVANAQGLFTPEAFYPLTGIKDLTPNVSVAEGVTILESAIKQQVDAGNNVAVVGFSQSSIISSLVMQKLAPGNTPSSLPIVFSLLGDPMNPNGGLLARFPDLTMPSLGFTFYGATPDNSFTTKIYTIEYDGFADFPEYPINLLADLNAIAGIYYVHGTYADLSPEQIATAIPLTNTVGPTMTSYYMIPNPDLPLVRGLRAIPILGNPLAELLEPDLRVLINLGYGSPDQGWSTGPPNVPTQFGLFPPIDPAVVADRLAVGTHQGINDFATALNAEMSSLASVDPAQALSSIQSIQPSSFSPPPITNVANTLASAISTSYAVLLPTADFVTAAVVSVPAYDLHLFANGILQALGGDPYGLVRAIGDPIAADTALFSIAAGFEAIVLINAAQSIIRDLSGLT
ncbi:PE family protein PE3 [Mycobacterium simulans]|uniref:PE family protein PE3 n=1 Tax=Mycobacterium simulans TaxID=627089 RepID=A0A7Z7N9V4_9MYCO|nr:PE-PPE domain-containing protein [Mycobacterium simulans]SOJ55174.1 PE family protein PE3 [Mycobacterium simulans]